MRHDPRFKNAAKSIAHTTAREKFSNKVKAQWDALLRRQCARDARSPQEQLRVLDVRLGNGIGAARERARLVEQIKNPTVKKQEATPQEASAAE